MMLRGILTAQGNFKAHGGGAKACTHGPFSLPALVRIPPANLLAYALILINALSGVFALLGV